MSRILLFFEDYILNSLIVDYKVTQYVKKTHIIHEN